MSFRLQYILIERYFAAVGLSNLLIGFLTCSYSNGKININFTLPEFIIIASFYIFMFSMNRIFNPNFWSIWTIHRLLRNKISRQIYWFLSNKKSEEIILFEEGYNDFVAEGWPPQVIEKKLNEKYYFGVRLEREKELGMLTWVQKNIKNYSRDVLIVNGAYELTIFRFKTDRDEVLFKLFWVHPSN